LDKVIRYITGRRNLIIYNGEVARGPRQPATERYL